MGGELDKAGPLMANGVSIFVSSGSNNRIP